MHFTKLGDPIVLKEPELRGIGQLYPYELWSYKKLDKIARPFLADNFSNWKGYNEVIGITNHNGLGRQWGIIIFHYPGSSEWKLVAQFGHRSGGLALRVLFARWLSRFFHYKNGSLERPRELQSLFPQT